MILALWLCMREIRTLYITDKFGLVIFAVVFSIDLTFWIRLRSTPPSATITNARTCLYAKWASEYKSICCYKTFHIHSTFASIIRLINLNIPSMTKPRTVTQMLFTD